MDTRTCQALHQRSIASPCPLIHQFLDLLGKGLEKCSRSAKVGNPQDFRPSEVTVLDHKPLECVCAPKWNRGEDPIPFKLLLDRCPRPIILVVTTTDYAFWLDLNQDRLKPLGEGAPKPVISHKVLPFHGPKREYIEAVRESKLLFPSRPVQCLEKLTNSPLVVMMLTVEPNIPPGHCIRLLVISVLQVEDVIV